MYNQTIRAWWPQNIIEKLKVAGSSCLSVLDSRVIVKVTSNKTARRHCCNCLKVEHCIVEIHLNSFHLYSSKKLLFKEVPCYTVVTDLGKWQCVSGLPAIAARFAEAMTHQPRSETRQCRGTLSYNSDMVRAGVRSGDCGDNMKSW